MISQKKLLLAVLMIIVAISLAGWIVLLRGYKTEPNGNTNAANTNISNINTTPNDNINGQQLNVNNQPIDTSDWQTYRNEELGFEVKYPSGWQWKDLSDNAVELFDPKSEYYNEYQQKTILPHRIIFSRKTKSALTILQELEKEATEDWMTSEWFQDLKKTAIINGLKANIVSPYSNALGLITISYVLIEKSGNTFLIEGIVDSGNNDFFRETFPSIYNTFQLIGE